MLKKRPPSLDQELGSQGFTLLELMVALGIGGISLLVSMTLLTTLYGRYIQVTSRTDAMESQLNAAYFLRQTLSLGVNISEAGGFLDNTTISGPPTDNGFLLVTDGSVGTNANFDRMSQCNSGLGLHAVGLFLRDAGGVGSVPSPQSNLVPTGIYYQCPTINTSGVIFMDLGNPAPPVGVPSAILLGPSYSKLFFDRIVKFDITNPQFAINPSGTRILTSVEIDIAVRTFFGNPLPSQMNWCPQADIQAGTAGCTTADFKLQNAAGFSDLPATFQVTLANQSLGANPSATGAGSYNQRVLGNIRFFPFPIPW